ncbi:MAG: 50S ribosomal protein L10 [Dehalococcoidales bacterium]|nr:50S ribosomal protein L10 [Dehalococcoidales bacterium]
MAREKKAQTIEELQKVLYGSSIGVMTNYRGLTTAELTTLRRKLRKSNIEFRVVKNTLARLAAEKIGWNDIARILEGPTAIAFSQDDITQPARILTEHIITTKSTLTIKGAFLRNRILTGKEVASLATLPPKDVLVAQVIGGMQGPIATLITYLNTPLLGMMITLQERIKQLEVK